MAKLQTSLRTPKQQYPLSLFNWRRPCGNSPERKDSSHLVFCDFVNGVFYYILHENSPKYAVSKEKLHGVINSFYVFFNPVGNFAEIPS